MGVYEYSNGGDGGGLVPRRRIRAFLVAGVFLFLVFAMLQIFMLEVRSSSVGRLVEDDVSTLDILW